MGQTKLLIIFSISLSAFILRFCFYHEIEEILWITSLFLDASLIGGGLFYIIATISSLYRRRTKWFGVTTIPLITAAIYFLGFTSIGPDVGVYSRLWRNESGYMRQVNKIMRTKSKEERDKLQYPIIIDEGPPIRIAFSWGGIVDNWHGIVYDPTGAVLKASEFKGDWSNWNSPTLAKVKKLFDGDMTSARHLWGPWYYCTFT
jgi:hypothetical protein